MSEERMHHGSFTISASNRDSSVGEVRRFLAELPGDKYSEIWIDHDEYPSICALINASRGWLMCLRYNGDAGFSTRNPEYRGAEDEEIEYILCNGQEDLYPASWTLPVDRVVAALEFFAEHGQTPDWLTWHNDSADGNSSPNEPFVELD